jgi:flagellar FliL protein
VADTTAKAETKDKGPSLMMFVVMVLLLTLVGAGTGFAVGALLGKPAEVAAEPPPVAATTAKAAPHGGEDKKNSDGEGHGGGSKSAPEGGGHGATATDGETLPPVEAAAPIEAEVPTVVVPLSPIITNLAAPDGTWVRVEGSLLARQESVEKPEVLAEKMTGNILAYLRTLRLAQIEGASGFLAFRDDLDDLVKTTSAGDVRQFMIKSLVVE